MSNLDSVTANHDGRRLSLTAMVVALVLILAACGSASKSPKTSSPKTSSGLGTQPITLEVGMWTNPPAVAAVKAIDKRFEKKYPNVTVKIDDAPTANSAWGTMWTTLQQSKTVDIIANYAGSPADFPPKYTGLPPNYLGVLFKKGDYVNLVHEPFMKYFNKTNQLALMGYNGGLYGLNVADYVGGADESMAFYNKTLLAKYHLSVPTTFNQLIHDCKVLKAHGITPFFGGAGFVFNGFFQEILMQGHPSSDAESVWAKVAKDMWLGRMNWNSKPFRLAAKESAELVQYLEPNAAGLSQLETPSYWATHANKYAFFIDGTWDGPTIEQANPALKFGAFSIPATNNAGDNRLLLENDLCWSVTSYAPQPKAAVAWLNFFAQPANYKLWVKDTGTISQEPAVTITNSWEPLLQKSMVTAIEPDFFPFLPPGAPNWASFPQESNIQPFGHLTWTQALDKSAAAYTAAVKKAGGK